MKTVLQIFILLFFITSCSKIEELTSKSYSIKDVKEQGLNNVSVTGVVENNFKILNNQMYELRDHQSGHVIIIFAEGNNLPKRGSTIEIKISKINLLTINDKEYSVYQMIK